MVTSGYVPVYSCVHKLFSPSEQDVTFVALHHPNSGYMDLWASHTVSTGGEWQTGWINLLSRTRWQSGNCGTYSAPVIPSALGMSFLHASLLTSFTTGSLMPYIESYNLYDKIRFATGEGQAPLWYGYIDREYFNTVASSGTASYDMSFKGDYITHQNLLPFGILVDDYSISLGVSGAYVSKSWIWQMLVVFTAVFDDYQERVFEVLSFGKYGNSALTMKTINHLEGVVTVRDDATM
jgi:hypothetical protein